jgi:hypothetical protein
MAERSYVGDESTTKQSDMRPTNGGVAVRCAEPAVGDPFVLSNVAVLPTSVQWLRSARKFGLRTRLAALTVLTVAASNTTTNARLLFTLPSRTCRKAARKSSNDGSCRRAQVEKSMGMRLPPREAVDPVLPTFILYRPGGLAASPGSYCSISRLVRMRGGQCLSMRW